MINYSHDDDDDVVDSKDTLFHDDMFAMNNFLIAFETLFRCGYVLLLAAGY